MFASSKSIVSVFQIFYSHQNFCSKINFCFVVFARADDPVALFKPFFDSPNQPIGPGKSKSKKQIFLKPTGPHAVLFSNAPRPKRSMEIPSSPRGYSFLFDAHRFLLTHLHMQGQAIPRAQVGPRILSRAQVAPRILAPRIAQASPHRGAPRILRRCARRCASQRRASDAPHHGGDRGACRLRAYPPSKACPTRRVRTSASPRGSTC